jgi:hypothetical protein
MSYTLTLHCGCSVYVACDPITQVAHTRVIETRGPACSVRKHEVGLRLYLWEMLPESTPRVVDAGDGRRPAPDGRRKAC